MYLSILNFIRLVKGPEVIRTSFINCRELYLSSYRVGKEAPRIGGAPSWERCFSTRYERLPIPGPLNTYISNQIQNAYKQAHFGTRRQGVEASSNSQ